MLLKESTDARGLTMTAESAAAVAAFDTFAARLIRIGQGVEEILEAAATYPRTPMIQISAAALCLFAQEPTADDAAADYLAAADRSIAPAEPREKAWLSAVCRWAAKDHLGAAAAFEAITEAWPADLLAAKTCEFLYYVLGQEQEGERFLAHMDRLAPLYANDAHFLAMDAFAHTLTGQCDDAVTIAERALSLDPAVPWAHHALAHALARRGDVEAAIARLTPAAVTWPHAGRVIDCHNSWHLAVLHIEQLDFAAAHDLLGQHVARPNPDLVQEHIDAISLLWRLEMAGDAVTDETMRRWRQLAARVEPVADTVYMPFLSAHQVFALARVDDEDGVAACLEAVEERTRSEDAEALRSWRPVGQALVRAAANFAIGDMARTAARLDPVIEQVTIGGGSDAQVDLFRQTYLASLIGCGRRSDARRYFERMTRQRPLSPLDRRWLERINAI